MHAELELGSAPQFALFFIFRQNNKQGRCLRISPDLSHCTVSWQPAIKDRRTKETLVSTKASKQSHPGWAAFRRNAGGSYRLPAPCVCSLLAAVCAVGREHSGALPPGTGSRALPQPPALAASSTEESQSHAQHSWPVCACCLGKDKFTQALSTLTSGTPTTPPDLRGNIPKASKLRPPKTCPF